MEKPFTHRTLHETGAVARYIQVDISDFVFGCATGNRTERGPSSSKPSFHCLPPRSVVRFCLRPPLLHNAFWARCFYLACHDSSQRSGRPTSDSALINTCTPRNYEAAALDSAFAILGPVMQCTEAQHSVAPIPCGIIMVIPQRHALCKGAPSTTMLRCRE